MREIRSSGSVEGVMGNHDSYSDFTLIIPSAAQLKLANDAMSVFNFAVRRNTTRHLRDLEFWNGTRLA